MLSPKSLWTAAADPVRGTVSSSYRKLCVSHGPGEEQSRETEESGAQVRFSFSICIINIKGLFFLPGEISFSNIILASQAGRKEIFLSPDPSTSMRTSPSSPFPAPPPTRDLNAIYVNFISICKVTFIPDIFYNTSHSQIVTFTRRAGGTRETVDKIRTSHRMKQKRGGWVAKMTRLKTSVQVSCK